jgi:3-hydroxyisobutyrate dehydrogenase-like beta-hydroxyacid dehydrogenase
VCAGWAERCAEVGVDMLDSPVSGGRAAAEQHTLTTMVGGRRDAADRCRPVFESFSTLIAHLGPPGAGQLAKLVNNTLMAANLKNSEDILALADALGFDLPGLVDVLLASSGANFSLEALAKHMTPELAGHYTKMVGKDVDHFSAAARARGVDESPIEAAARQGVAGIVAAVDRLQRGSRDGS